MIPLQTKAGASLALLISLAPLMFSSCQKNQTAEDSLPLASLETTPEPRLDNWQRIKECAEQADKMAERANLEVGQGGRDLTVLGWDNHYNPGYERCYLRVSYLNHNVRPELKDTIPVVYYELHDAFEGRLLSMCTDAVLSNTPFCVIAGNPDSIGNCNLCRQFVKDRMED